MVTGQDIASKAREAMGTRWHHMGRLAGHGLDCIGLILWTARQLGLSDFEPPPYGKTSHWHEFIITFRQNLKEVRIDALQVGDVLTFRQLVYPCHCGIVTEVTPHSIRFIHSYALRKKVVEEEYTPIWKKATVAAFRFPNLEG